MSKRDGPLCALAVFVLSGDIPRWRERVHLGVYVCYHQYIFGLVLLFRRCSIGANIAENAINNWQALWI